jgi:DNA polymerase III delta prime subunit
MADLAEEYVLRCLENEDDEGDPEIKLFKVIEKNKQKNRKINNLRNLIWDANKEGDEDTLDSLEKLCDENKLSYEAIFDSTQETLSKPISYDNPVGVNAAEAFLQENTIIGTEYKVADMTKLMEIRGFSNSVINVAKRQIGFNSVRHGNCWYWIRQ